MPEIATYYVAAPDREANYYRGFTPDHDPADALRVFRALYGCEPAEQPRVDHGILTLARACSAGVVGPVPTLQAVPR